MLRGALAAAQRSLWHRSVPSTRRVRIGARRHSRRGARTSAVPSRASAPWSATLVRAGQSGSCYSHQRERRNQRCTKQLRVMVHRQPEGYHHWLHWRANQCLFLGCTTYLVRRRPARKALSSIDRPLAIRVRAAGYIAERRGHFLDAENASRPPVNATPGCSRRASSSATPTGRQEDSTSQLRPRWSRSRTPDLLNAIQALSQLKGGSCELFVVGAHGFL
jgi:hypothetical protein